MSIFKVKSACSLGVIYRLPKSGRFCYINLFFHLQFSEILPETSHN